MDTLDIISAIVQHLEGHIKQCIYTFCSRVRLYSSSRFPIKYHSSNVALTTAHSIPETLLTNFCISSYQQSVAALLLQLTSAKMTCPQCLFPLRKVAPLNETLLINAHARKRSRIQGALRHRLASTSSISGCRCHKHYS
jgi:hypothetical protein